VLSDFQTGLHVSVGQKVEETWAAPKLSLLKDAENDLRELLVAKGKGYRKFGCKESQGF
jgi:hypothetical protein